MANPTPKQQIETPDNAFQIAVVAAILLAGESFKKSLKENELPAIAKRLVNSARIIVEASYQS